MPNKSFFNWSGGKDSAMALHRILQDPDYRIDSLFTSVNAKHQRISMHGVREELLDLQAVNLKIPLQKIYLSEHPSMEEYNQKMEEKILQFKNEGYSHSVFGDIFLEDLKKYREEKLAQHGMIAAFPIWKRNTKELLEEFLALGFKTILVCVDAKLLEQSFAGRIIDEQFINDLPENVDPCGENGEFHTFVFDGPIFEKPIPIQKGEVVYREYPAPNTDSNESKKMGFWFCDLIPNVN